VTNDRAEQAKIFLNRGGCWEVFCLRDGTLSSFYYCKAGETFWLF
jgi:hypothetical protein